MHFSTEPDLYGFSTWLATHLGFPLVPRSLRGYQHGWIWWSHSDAPYLPGMGLDPNSDPFWGQLVQDRSVESYLLSRGVYAKAAGLPFLTYYNYCGLKGVYAKHRRKEVLYIPTHSNPWNDYSEGMAGSTAKVIEIFGDISVMLGVNDQSVANKIAPLVKRVETGAGVYDSNSFFRIMSIFESYEYVVTDCVGSHVCYALACGAKVGIIDSLYTRYFEAAPSKQNPDDLRLKKSKYFAAFKSVNSLQYLDNKFPGIVINRNLPTYSKAPECATERPDIIAELLGWRMTIDSMIPQQGKPGRFEDDGFNGTH